jgi:serpin B
VNRRDFLVRSLAAAGALPAFAVVPAACGDEPPSSSNPSPTPSTPSGGTGEARSSALRRSPSSNAATSGAAVVNGLGASLFGALAGGAPNLVFSPASIAIAMSMARAGAAGTTATEIDAVLAADASLHDAMNGLTAALVSRPGSFQAMGETVDVELAIANSLWGQDGLTWKQPFLDVLAAEYGAGLRLVDFVKDPEAARRAVNAWVDDETEQRIPELLAEGTVTSDWRLTLVNAVYMKAPWSQPFNDTLTADATFTTLSGSTVQVPMMRSSNNLSYASGPGWQAISLPYAGDALDMLLVVPDAGALAQVESELPSGLLDRVGDALSSRLVNLGMPTFDIETGASLGEVLRALGMPSAFDPDTADFSAMTDDQRLFIAAVVHQANITVDENGTEAAAATAIGMATTSAPIDPPVDLVIDRPFLFAVRDVPTGAVVFLGRIGDPSARR